MIVSLFMKHTLFPFKLWVALQKKEQPHRDITTSFKTQLVITLNQTTSREKWHTWKRLYLETKLLILQKNRLSTGFWADIARVNNGLSKDFWDFFSPSADIYHESRLPQETQLNKNYYDWMNWVKWNSIVFICLEYDWYYF